MSTFKTTIDAKTSTFAANKAAMLAAVDEFRAVHAKIEAGAKHQLYRVERRPKAPQRLWMRSM